MMYQSLSQALLFGETIYLLAVPLDIQIPVYFNVSFVPVP